MLAVSFLIGIYLAAYRANGRGLKPQLILDLSVYIIVAAVVGSRLLYVLFHVDEYSNPLEVFALWQGGATFYGGLALAIIVSYVFVSRKGLSFLLVADILAPSIAVGLAVTRVGCFLSGCCYGTPTTAPWGVEFPPASSAAQSAAEAAARLGITSIGLHPTQLYASASGLLIFVAVLLLEKYLKKRGAVFGAFLVLYGIARFNLDFFRFYEENARVLLSLTFNQLVSVGLVIVGVFFFVRRGAGAGRATRA
jgi:phosphatidylglycerol:prolipoprotein diacylglycerol transferase